MNAEWRQLSTHVYVRHHEWLQLNLGVVVGDEGAVLVDTGWSAAQGREIREELTNLLSKPVIAAANTHCHFDHTWGNSEFADGPLWGHEGCRKEMIEGGERHRELVLGFVPERLISEIADVRIVPPDRVFSERAQISLGSVALDMSHFGRGHTDHDIVVEVRDEGVMFAGDLVEECGPPVFFDSFPISWPLTLERAIANLDGAIVPGHGAIADRAFGVSQMEQLHHLAELARDVRDGGRSIEEAALAGPYDPETMRIALARGATELATP